jgi:hypothetical protein
LRHTGWAMSEEPTIDERLALAQRFVESGAIVRGTFYLDVDEARAAAERLAAERG